jgi:hypothetical protein
VSHVSYYQAKRCQGCPFLGQCHKAQGNRTIEVNHRLNELKQKAKERLMSETGLYHRSKRPIEPEAAFGQIKSNNKFNRFTLKGLPKVEIEFGLMAIAHNLRKLVAKTVFLSVIVHYYPLSRSIFGQFEVLFSFQQCALVELKIKGKENTPFKNAA